MMAHTMYHRLLRIAALTVAVVLAFDSGIINPATRVISSETQSYLAASVGMSAAVTPTDLNQMTAALTAKQQELQRQEQALKQREIAVNLRQPDQGTGMNYSSYILSVLLFIILVLIILNYILDYVRYRRQLTLSQT